MCGHGVDMEMDMYECAVNMGQTCLDVWWIWRVVTFCCSVFIQAKL